MDLLEVGDEVIDGVVDVVFWSVLEVGCSNHVYFGAKGVGNGGADDLQAGRIGGVDQFFILQGHLGHFSVEVKGQVATRFGVEPFTRQSLAQFGLVGRLAQGFLLLLFEMCSQVVEIVGHGPALSGQDAPCPSDHDDGELDPGFVDVGAYVIEGSC